MIFGRLEQRGTVEHLVRRTVLEHVNAHRLHKKPAEMEELHGRAPLRVELQARIAFEADLLVGVVVDQLQDVGLLGPGGVPRRLRQVTRGRRQRIK